MDWHYWLKVSAIVVVAYLLSLSIQKIIGFFIQRKSLKVNLDTTNFSVLKNSVTFIFNCDFNEWVKKKRFDNEGIEMPFPYKTITYK